MWCGENVYVRVRVRVRAFQAHPYKPHTDLIVCVGQKKMKKYIKYHLNNQMSVSHKAEEYGNYPATLEEFVGFVVFLTHTIHSTLSVTHSTMSQKFISHIEKFHTLTRDSMIRSTKQYIKHYTYRHTVHHGWGDGCWFTLYRSSCIEKEQNAIEELKTTFVSNLIRDLMKIWRVVGLYDKIFMIEWISKMIPFRLFLSKLWDGIMRYEKAKHKREVYYKKYQSEAKSQVKRSEGEELEQRLRKWNESKNKTRRFVKYQDEHDYEDIECQLNKKEKKEDIQETILNTPKTDGTKEGNTE